MSIAAIIADDTDRTGPLIPLYDDNPHGARPYATFLIIAVCIGVYFLLQPHQPADEIEFLYRTASIPCEVTTGAPLSASEIASGWCNSSDEAPLFPYKSVPASLVVSVFLHGGLFHLVSNMWVLGVFGNNVEDAVGRIRYLVFYLLAGLVGSLTYVAMNPSSTIPLVGASGAIAGLMGAYLVLFPTNRVTSIVPPLLFWPFRVPALLFIGFWLFGQFNLDGTGIAWETHLAGFAVGVLYGLWMLLTRRRRPR